MRRREEVFAASVRETARDLFRGGDGYEREPQQPAAPPARRAQPSEEELRAAYEAELARITATDMIVQAAVSLLNIGGAPAGPASGARRGAGPAGTERDLEQVRDAIDAARALLGILERRPADELAPLRDALSRLQMAYARRGRRPGRGRGRSRSGR